MEKKKKSIGLFIIASAIIWGIVILGCSLKLSGTDCFDEILYILSVGATFHLIFIWGPLAIRLNKIKKGE
ncbi:MAG: hypothetical protein CL661_01470 [Bacteroidetes bacterium]|jgi:hypothetical protein|nr:hypothetical protein [Bacteroidota bacterium]|tara:strand:- start:2704 stop:2913 length:210 start_codon:yes stop_codon:yes gene_type:complete